MKIMVDIGLIKADTSKIYSDNFYKNTFYGDQSICLQFGRDDFDRGHHEGESLDLDI